MNNYSKTELLEVLEEKQDELYFLKQVFKNLTYLHNMYADTILKNETRARFVEVSLNNARSEIKRVKKDIDDLAAALKKKTMKYSDMYETQDY